MANRKRKDDDETDTTERTAAEEIEAELAAGKQTGKHTTQSRSDGDVEVDLDEEEDDDDSEPAAASDPAASRRAEKRRDRYRENRERAERLEKELNDTRERERQATLRADAMALHFRQGSQAQPEKSPLDSELEAAEAERQRLWDDVEAAPGPLAPERIADINKRAREIDRKIYSLVARKEMQAHQPPPGISPGRMLADTQFPDVMAHPEGSKRTDALLQYKLALGEPNTPQTLIAALTEVRKQLGTGGQRRDTSSLKAKLGHSSASRGGGGEPAARRTVTLTPAMRKLAKATYKGMDEAKAFKLFAQNYMQDEE